MGNGKTQRLSPHPSLADSLKREAERRMTYAVEEKQGDHDHREGEIEANAGRNEQSGHHRPENTVGAVGDVVKLFGKHVKEFGESKREKSKIKLSGAERDGAGEEGDKARDQRRSDESKPKRSNAVQPGKRHGIGANPVKRGLAEGDKPRPANQEIGRGGEEGEHQNVLENKKPGSGHHPRRCNKKKSGNPDTNHGDAATVCSLRHIQSSSAQARCAAPKSPEGRVTSTMIIAKKMKAGAQVGSQSVPTA